MFTRKGRTLQPLLESSEGIHLTAYIPKPKDTMDLQESINKAIFISEEYLTPALSKQDFTAFLEPLRKLTQDSSALKKMNSNIGIFRTKNSFRVMSIPVRVEFTCVVATTFHVKPLIRWIQQDREFLFLGFSKKGASLYKGSKDTFTCLQDLHHHSTSLPQEMNLESNLIWLADKIENITHNEKPMLFFAGDKNLISAFLKHLRYSNIYPQSLYPSFKKSKARKIRNMIRKILQNEAQQSLEQSLLEFKVADHLKLTKKNIFQITKAAVFGRVRKLLVADEVKIFGKIDKKTGGLTINPTDLDHEDDDILDDLAQTVLKFGGEVVVAKREDIPKGSPLLAILETPSPELEARFIKENRAAI